jgi:hypothetical protein
MSEPLFEDEVVNAVRDHLESEGYRIESYAKATEHGDDIVAESADGEVQLYIEAKGETSSREGSKRYGKPFTRNQVKDHVAKAFYRAAKMRENRSGSETMVGVAFPKNQDHEEMVGEIENALSDLEIEVFWVDSETQVTAAGNW